MKQKPVVNSEFLDANREGWNRRTPVHLTSDFYNVKAFRSERALSLNPPELQLLGDVRGKRMLHLQCHFGLDTLSWTRLGAIATGVDFSEASIEAARKLSHETNTPATFLCADVQNLEDEFSAEFDIVYTSYGVVPWLEDLDAWLQGINSSLKPGGIFALIEFHPAVDLFHEGQISGQDTYFGKGEPDGRLVSGTYTNRAAPISFVRYNWQHNLSEVITAVLKAGLLLRHFQEYPGCSYKLFPELEIRKEGLWYPREHGQRIPYMYSLLAEKP